MIKNKILKFETSDEVFEPMGQIKKVMPDWYKRIERFKNGKIDIGTLTVKNCYPFMDSFLTGYYIPTPVDFVVVQTGSGPEIKCKSINEENNSTSFIGKRDGGATNGMPVPYGFNKQEFTWITRTIIQSPKGYSLLVTHPLNRPELPFYTLSGVVDAEYGMQGGNLPFFIKNVFEGLIPAGTPIAQVIPIKRENWKLVRDPSLLKLNELNGKYSQKYAFGWYKKFHWNKKEYN